MIAVILVNIAYTLLVPGISVSGHLGGAVGGAVAMLMVPGVRAAHSRRAARCRCPRLGCRCRFRPLRHVGGLAFLQGLWAWRSCPYWRNAFSTEKCV